ncbi:hypothetical protein [Mucisphaera calidilacus]|uniref:Uncharacterized protein n=1 Tax=Mucisphaera calidilacus TaxID=2527982 RepID=A0A518BTZ8_9BACT|nr:hypothetical protein [Mucisphaera calidilacus]QDU70451.1 hypothetical protein Pan265_02790 [Mucisphaera calidilacus]
MRRIESPFADLVAVDKRARRLDLVWRQARPEERVELDIVAEVMRSRFTHSRSALLSPPTRDEADGPLRLGRIHHGRQELGYLGLHKHELMQDALFTGRSGSGKSTACLNLMIKLIDQDVPWTVIEIKQGLSPKLGRGFYSALEDLEPDRAFVVYAGRERYPLADSVEAIGLAEICSELTS